MDDRVVYDPSFLKAIGDKLFDNTNFVHEYSNLLGYITFIPSKYFHNNFPSYIIHFGISIWA